MSMILWLPMIDDFRNNGILNPPISHTASIANGGLLGSGCARFNNSNITIGGEIKKFINGAFSFSFWTKIISWNADSQTIVSVVTNNSTECFSFKRNGTGNTFIFSANNGTSSANCSSGTVSLSTWIYFACVYDGTRLMVYQNGQLANTTSASLNIDYNNIKNIFIGSSGNARYSNMDMTDFRLYGYTLHPLEIRQISLGLCVHLPLSKSGVNTYLDSIEYDASGYLNNGERVGAFSWTATDCPRHIDCATFTNSCYIKDIKTPKLLYSWSICWWGNSSAINSGVMPWSFSDGNRLALFIQANSISLVTPGGDFSLLKTDVASMCDLVNQSGTYLINESGAQLITQSCYQGSQINGGWHHCAVTSDGSQISFYIDGIYIGKFDKLLQPTGTTLCLSSRGYDGTNSNAWVGSLSDFRLYARCLAIDDILRLVKAPISVASDGKLLAADYREDMSSVSFYKTGVVSAPGNNTFRYTYDLVNENGTQLTNQNGDYLLDIFEAEQGYYEGRQNLIVTDYNILSNEIIEW